MKPGQLIKYLETLTITLGDCAGEQFTVLPWEKRFIRNVWGEGCGGDAAFSAGRGQGKSGLVAGIATACVDPSAPLHSKRGEIVCTAASFSQAKSAIFEEVLEFLKMKHGPDLPARTWRIQDSQNMALVEHRPTGARVRCTGSKPKTLHGLKPKLWLWDEPAQAETSQIDSLYAAIKTGLGKVPGSRLIALGTRPAFDDHPFAKLLSGGAQYSQVHAAEPNDKPFLVSTWRKANPSWDLFPTLRERIRLEAADARRDPSALASFKALRLNMGLDDTVKAMLLDAGVWQSIEGAAECKGEYIMGVDCGQSAAMSGFTAYWPSSGALRCFAVFPEQPDLAVRGLADGCGNMYRQMQDRGELILAGELVSDIGEGLRHAIRLWGKPGLIVADDWRMSELTQEANRVRFPSTQIVARRMGWKDGAEDVRCFRKAVLSGYVVPEISLLLRAALSSARVIADPAGNWKLAKNSQGGRRQASRDDAAAAAILCIAMGYRWIRDHGRPSTGVKVHII